MTRMRMFAALAALGGTCLLFSGCGAGGGFVGCDFRNATKGNAEPRCQDANGLVATTGTYQSTCTASGGVFQAGGCPTAGIVAGCEQKTNNADGSTAIDWYYAPKTSAEVQTSCTSPSTFRASK